MARSQISPERNGENKVRKPPFSALLTYSTDRNMCKGAIEFEDECGLRKRQSALFMNASYFNNLRKYATEEDREIAEIKRRERLKDLENSKSLSKAWWDTPENFKRAIEEKKQKQRKKYEEESERIFREMEIANRESERRILADAKTMKFQSRQDIKELHSACVLSEVLNERAAQICFNEKLKRLKDGREKQYNEKDMEANSVYFKNEADKAMEKRKAGLEYGRELIEQINSRNELKCEIEKEERERELKFFDMLSHLKNEDTKRKNVEEYLQNLKDGELIHKFIEEERQKDDEMEDKHIKDYHESVSKLNEAIKNKKNEKLVNLKAKSEAAVASLKFFKKKLLDREAREREAMERDIKRLAERQEQRALDDEKRSKKLGSDFLADNIKQRIEEEAKKKAQSLMKNLDRLHAMKAGEDCQQIKESSYHQEKEKQMITRAILKEQMDFRAMVEEKEKEEMEKYRKGIIILQNKEDKEFLEYAKAMIGKSKSNGRDVRPMEKLLKKFCQRRKFEN